LSADSPTYPADSANEPPPTGESAVTDAECFATDIPELECDDARLLLETASPFGGSRGNKSPRTDAEFNRSRGVTDFVAETTPAFLSPEAAAESREPAE
jgi:hypothetical protein